MNDVATLVPNKPKKEDERDFAKRLANAVLDNPRLDPDGDLSVLARQLLRAFERIENLEEMPI